MTNDEHAKALATGARAYYEWATTNRDPSHPLLDSEPSRWDEPNDHGGYEHQTFALARAEVIIDAALAAGALALPSEVDGWRRAANAYRSLLLEWWDNPDDPPPGVASIAFVRRAEATLEERVELDEPR